MFFLSLFSFQSLSVPPIPPLSPLMFYISLAASTAAAHGLSFSFCRSSLKSNTGTRSHLPSMAQMPSTVLVPCSHKTEDQDHDSYII